MSDSDTTRAVLTEDGLMGIGPDGKHHPLVGETDWQCLEAMTDEEIALAAASDPDARLRTAEELANARRVGDLDVRAIRKKRDLTQAAFARRYGFSLSALRDWERGLRTPDRLAELLLRVIEHEPDAIERAMARS